MRRAFAVLMVIAATSPAGAQIRRRAPRVPEPSLWLSGSIGLFNANDVSDGATNSTWDFGRASNPQYRASLEKAINNTTSIGVTGTYVHVPFTYIGPSDVLFDAPRGGTATGGSCQRCAAHLDVISLGASFHVGGGLGLHQVLEASAGAVQYRNIKRDSDKSALAPADGNIDPYFTFGYGFGYSLNRDAEVSVVQDFGLALHERTGLTSEQSNTLRQRTIRLNLRFGFGDRAPRR